MNQMYLGSDLEFMQQLLSGDPDYTKWLDKYTEKSDAMQSNEINELFEALSKAQAEMVGAKKGSENPFFKSKYADLQSILEAVREPLAKHDLCVTQTVNSPDVGSAVITTTLGHKSGQWMQGNCPIINTKGDAQGMGSAITYARRYSLAAICGIAQMDDDGNTAVTAPPLVKIPQKQQKEFQAQITGCLESGDHDGVEALWAEWDNDDGQLASQ